MHQQIINYLYTHMHNCERTELSEPLPTGHETGSVLKSRSVQAHVRFCVETQIFLLGRLKKKSK